MAESAAIELRGLSKRFGHAQEQVTALDNVSLIIRENEFFTLLGPSGCGKTTLLRLLAGFEQPSSGELLLEGTSLAGLPPYRRPVNTVFQSYALFPHMSVADNIGFGLEMQGREQAERAQRVQEMLALVKLHGLENRYPAQLSGGQQQRVALARALANQPKVLLLDEPLSALDLKLRKEMQIELKRLQLETGITFVFVTHDQEEALTMSDRIAVMQHGQILQIGSPKTIYEQPSRRFVADFIGESNFLEAEYIAANDGWAHFRLPGGVELSALEDPLQGYRNGQKVTLVIRPERASLCDAGSGQLQGVVENVIYLGTDTVVYLRLDGADTLFQLRSQNQYGAATALGVGDHVTLNIAPEAVRVLTD
ncbi:MAG: ABC transporter ATP-binding protein [Gammaproteobacteria bacterium]